LELRWQKAKERCATRIGRKGRCLHVRRACASSNLAYRTGKRDTDNTMEFSHDLRERVIGSPEISADGVHPYKVAIRNAFGRRIVHGIITKTYSATHLAVKDAARRAIHRLR
jgi:hypothetical protein